MAGVYKITISESKAELKKLLITQKTGVNKERIQLLYLLKTEQVATVTAAAKIIGRNRVTAQDWMSKYRAGGIERLLERKTLDNGAFHKAKRLQVPSNIILLFQPPYTPELNPIERVWQHLKRGLRWKLPRNLEELREMMKNRLEEMTVGVIASVVGWDCILDALSVAGI
jgi:transposase